MSLKKEIKTVLLATLKNEGLPPILDKTFKDIWDIFAKTQPNALTTSTVAGDTDIWGNLDKVMVKHGVSQPITTKVVNKLKKQFGENPSLPDIKAMMSS